MTDAATIAGGLQSLQAAFQIGKALLKLGISAEVRDRITEMNERIFEARESAVASQEHQMALLKQVDDLEKQVANFEAWEAEAKTYQLTDLRQPNDPRGSIFAFAPKEGTHSSEPAHLICTECYSNRHKSILQHQDIAGRIPALLCSHCNNLIYLEGERPDPLSPKRRKPINTTW